MGQITSATSSVTATNGLIWENLPINPLMVIRAYKLDDFRLNNGDTTNYPAIKFVVDYGFQKDDDKPPVDDNCQFWAYAFGDTATCDADFLIVDAAIGSGSSGGGGGGGSGPVIETNKTIVATPTYTVLDTDYRILVTVNSILTLPVITAANDGIVFRIYAIDSRVRVNAGGGDSINNRSSFTLRRRQQFTLRACLTYGWAIGD